MRVLSLAAVLSTWRFASLASAAFLPMAAGLGKGQASFYSGLNKLELAGFKGRKQKQTLFWGHKPICSGDTRSSIGHLAPMVPFWDRCTTHFRTYFSEDWDVCWWVRFGF